MFLNNENILLCKLTVWIYNINRNTKEGRNKTPLCEGKSLDIWLKYLQVSHFIYCNGVHLQYSVRFRYSWVTGWELLLWVHWAITYINCVQQQFWLEMIDVTVEHPYKTPTFREVVMVLASVNFYISDEGWGPMSWITLNELWVKQL